MVSYRGLGVGVFVLVSSCSEDESLTALTLRVEAREGAPQRVVAAATMADGTVGRGKVRFSSEFGSLEEEWVPLDAYGKAFTAFTCNGAVERECLKPVTLTATWEPTGSSAKVKALPGPLDTEAAACSPARRRPLSLLTSTSSSVRVAVPPSLTEHHESAAGAAVYDANSKVAAVVALVQPRAGLDLAAEEVRLRTVALMHADANAANPLVQQIVLANGAIAMNSHFDIATSDELASRLDQMARELGEATHLSTMPPTKGPFRAELLVSRVHAKELVAFALTPAAEAGDLQLATLEHFAGGSALSLDSSNVTDQCDTYTVTSNAMVDLIWVVDDSCSMATSQDAVARTGMQIERRIEGLDVRAAGVSTGFYPASYDGSYRDWTTSPATMFSWFSGASAWGTSGSGIESGFDGLRTFLIGPFPPRRAAPAPVRPGADVHIIFLSDAPDQSAGTVDDMYEVLDRTFANHRFVAHGVICPESLPGATSSCGDSAELEVGRYHELIRKTGGVLGSILTFNPKVVTQDDLTKQNATMNAIAQQLFASTGHVMSHPPIRSSIRVAVSRSGGSCPLDDVPQSASNGWYLDPSTSRLVIVGACAPSPGTKVSVSYSAWQ